MALIYASAVNKRINSVPRSKRSVIEPPPSSTTTTTNNISPPRINHQEAFSHRKQRSNDETHRTVHLNGHSESVPPVPSPRRHKAHLLQRADTNESDAASTKRKMTVGCSGSGSADRSPSSQPAAAEQRVHRKISTPAAVDTSCHGSSMRKTLAKKLMAEEGATTTSGVGVAHSSSSHALAGGGQPSKEAALLKCMNFHKNFYQQKANCDRRRSISLDASSTANGEWIDGVEYDSSSDYDQCCDSKLSPFQRMKMRFNKWKLSS